MKKAKIINIKKDANDVLEMSKDNYEEVLILGYNKEGYLTITRDTKLTKSQTFLLVEQFKNHILNGIEDE